MTEEERTGKVQEEYAAYNRKEVEKEIEPPPIFKTWNGLYAFVLGVFVVLVILFYIFTIYYK